MNIVKNITLNDLVDVVKTYNSDDVEKIKSKDTFLAGQFASYHAYPAYPDYFGFMEPVRIEILGLDVIERLFGNEAKILVELLRKAKYYCKDLNPDAPRLKLIEIVDGDKRIEIK